MVDGSPAWTPDPAKNWHSSGVDIRSPLLISQRLLCYVERTIIHLDIPLAGASAIHDLFGEAKCTSSIK
jgi:hypothetical protein